MVDTEFVNGMMESLGFHRLKQKPCPDCNGYGLIDNIPTAVCRTYVLCTRCEGTGKVVDG